MRPRYKLRRRLGGSDEFAPDLLEAINLIRFGRLGDVIADGALSERSLGHRWYHQSLSRWSRGNLWCHQSLSRRYGRLQDVIELGFRATDRWDPPAATHNLSPEGVWTSGPEGGGCGGSR